VFIPFALGYFLSYLYRTVNAIIAPDLVRDIGLDPASLGLLTSAYLLAFGLFQLPLGLLLDRFGPRRVEATLLLIAAAAALIFSQATSLTGLVVGRALIGLGVSACLMAAFKSFALWFPPERLPLANAIQMISGGLGAMAATTPVEAALKLTDWRGLFLFFALLTLTVRPWRFVSGWKLWVLASLFVLLLGLGVEFIQSLSGRDMDGRDMFRNLTGLWAVLALQQWAAFQKPYPIRTWLTRILAGILLAIDLSSVTRIAVQQVQVSQWLPDLYDFQHEYPARFWSGQVARSSTEDCGPLAENALSIALTTRRYSGASLHNLPSDWRDYKELNFVLWNPQSDTLPLTLRINDLAHEQGENEYNDRFNRSFQITPGINLIHQNLNDIATAPRDRRMDMGKIRRLMFFTSGLNQPGRLCLSDLKQVRGDAPVGLD
jgi:MFS family permease